MSVHPLQVRDTSAPRVLTVVCPAYNESSNLVSFMQTLDATMTTQAQRYNVLFVNDGSRDDSLTVMLALRSSYEHVGIIDLSRNFGKEVAVSAGLDHAEGDAVVIMDADGQHPAELIPALIERYRDGFELVVASRTDRSTDSTVRSAASRAFYWLMRRSGDVPLPPNAGDFRLLSKTAVEQVRQMREHHRFLKGMFAWLGLPTAYVPFTPPPRLNGKSTFSLWRLWNFSLEGITSHTLAPLRASTYVGFAVACLALMYGLYIVGKTLILGDPVAGFPTIATLVLFLGGLQLMVLGVMGEYLGRVFNEVKQRPLYIAHHIWRPRSE